MATRPLARIDRLFPTLGARVAVAGLAFFSTLDVGQQAFPEVEVADSEVALHLMMLWSALTAGAALVASRDTTAPDDPTDADPADGSADAGPGAPPT